MHVITITNIDHNLLEVEVSVDVYKVYEDSRRQEERQRYEYRKHIDGRSFDNCLLFELATEPLTYRTAAGNTGRSARYSTAAT